MATLEPDSSLLYNYDFDTKDNIEKMGKLLSRFDTGITGMDFFPWKEGEENLKLYITAVSETIAKYREGRMSYSKKRDHTTTSMCCAAFTVIRKHQFVLIRNLTVPNVCGTSPPVLLRDDIEFVYVIDELDRYLHPKVVYAFIEWFMKKNFKTPKQIIGIGHNTHLLDQDLVRRDEIWFADKDVVGASELCSLDDYNVRFDKKIEKAYLEGNFKGLPNIVLPSDLDDY
ncbi:hypothetical protein AOA81_06305 [Methanomassiliicoccales archaeon RumEn M2]|nr:hypothetical protein AOA81_06305 [Methanomassiliicoccales archaeon RumEn M2]